MPPYEQISSILWGFWQARALAVATEFGLADILADGPLPVDVLASRTQTAPAALFRLLRALETIGIFSQVSPNVFGNSPASEFLRTGVPGSQRSLTLAGLSIGNGQFEAWCEFEHSIRTGTPSFDKVHGCNFWEFGRRNPTASKLFDDFMKSVSESMTPGITAAYDWNEFPVIIDVGGGIGTQLMSILEVSPSSNGILFDQPHVVAGLAAHERMEIVSGDFFVSVPRGGDAYILRWILHDWSDTNALEILRCVRRALTPTARLILVESVIAEGPTFDFGKWLDLQMLTMLEGRERTEKEFGTLLRSAGFALERTVSTKTPTKILIANPI